MRDKAVYCKKNNIDVLIDDDDYYSHSVAEAGIKVLYFRDRNVRHINHHNLIEVDNWMHIYKEILKLETDIVDKHM